MNDLRKKLSEYAVAGPVEEPVVEPGVKPEAPPAEKPARTEPPAPSRHPNPFRRKTPNPSHEPAPEKARRRRGNVVAHHLQTLANEAVDVGPHPDFIDPEKKKKIERGTHPFAKNPAFPDVPGEGSWPGEEGTHLKPGNPKIKSYADLVSSDQYSYVAKRLAHYLGRVPQRQEVGSLLMGMMNAVKQAQQIESSHVQALEKMAVEVVLSLPEFQQAKSAYESGDLKIVAKLNSRGIHLNAPVEPQEPDEYMQSQLAIPEIAQELGDEAHKRRMVNLMMQGSAINKNFAFRLVDDKLAEIDPELSGLYGIIMATADFAYWLLPEEMQKMAMGSGEAAGKESLEFEEEGVTIKAEAAIFPVLIQEIVKGLMEYISYDESEDPETRQHVLGQSDTLGGEVWDIKMGPAIWRQILRVIGNENQNLTPQVYQHLVSLSPVEFQRVMKSVLQGTPEGKNYMKKLVDEIKSEQQHESAARLLMHRTIMDARQIVYEDRFDFLKQKYLPLIRKKMGLPEVPQGAEPGPKDKAEELFKKLMTADPTARITGVEFAPGQKASSNYAGNYTEWVLKQFLASDNANLFLEDIPGMRAQLELFNRLKGRLPADKRDINKLDKATLFDAVRAIEDIKGVYAGAAAKEAPEETYTDRKILYKDSSVICIRPLSWEGSRRLNGVEPSSSSDGKNAWCTAWAGDRGRNMWKQYNDGDKKFLVIFRFKDGADYQMEINNSKEGGYQQLMDRADRPVNLLKVLDHHKGSTEETDNFLKFVATLSNAKYQAVKARAEKAGALDPRLQRLMPADLSKESPAVITQLSKAKNLSDAERQGVLKYGNLEAVKNVIANSKLSPAERKLILSGGQPDVVAHLCENQVLDQAELQDVMARFKDDNNVIEKCIAYQQVGDDYVRRVVKSPGSSFNNITLAAKNPFNSPALQLELLNPSAWSDPKERNARLKQAAVLLGTATNPNVTDEALERLLTLETELTPGTKPGQGPIGKLVAGVKKNRKKA